MQPKISKTLENMMARVVFRTTRAHLNTTLGDRLALEILREEGSLAYRLIATRLREWEIADALKRLDHHIGAVAAYKVGGINPERYFKTLTGELISSFPAAAKISTAHALIHLLSEPHSPTLTTFEMYGMNAFILTHELQRLIDGEEPTPVTAADNDNSNSNENNKNNGGNEVMICKYGADLTRQAHEGRIDPITGRETEIERMIQVLSRRKKNNPLLVGEAGVGKSALVEGLALRLAAGSVPHTLQGKRLIALDLTALLAGTRYRGEFEERMQRLIDELKRADDVIVFIDEIHTIVGAGAAGGSLDTANILKPALARSEIQTIGATTLDEYRQYFASDAALERRFQRIIIEPTSPQETLHILREIAPNYARHHRVVFTEEALSACVELADRYLTDRQFPDKAIDLLDEAGSRSSLSPQGNNTPPPRIGVQEIREVITLLTGIPTEELSTDHRNRYAALRHRLSERIIGQDHAVERIANSIGHSGAGLSDEGRPLGVFLFVGLTGVGKTLMAKEIARQLFGDERGLLRFDMSEYGEKHQLSRLIGSPPGYVGYGEGGQLTEAVRRRPYSVILFDEIEKAHPELLHLLLQLFDEGRLTDGMGRCVDFRHTILIMTSNLGANTAPTPRQRMGYLTDAESTSPQESTEHYHTALEQHFPPELMNRIDDIVVFRRLSAADTEKILELELAPIIDRVRRLGFTLRITDEAKRHLSRTGFESRYGVRALRRTLKEQIEEPLSQLILSGSIDRGATIIAETEQRQVIRLKVA